MPLGEYNRVIGILHSDDETIQDAMICVVLARSQEHRMLGLPPSTLDFALCVPWAGQSKSSPPSMTCNLEYLFRQIGNILEPIIERYRPYYDAIVQ